MDGQIKPRFFVIITVMLLCVTAVVMLNTRRAENDIALYTAEAEATVERLNESISEKESTLTYRQSDAYVERVARDELDMLRPGEYCYTAR